MEHFTKLSWELVQDAEQLLLAWEDKHPEMSNEGMLFGRGSGLLIFLHSAELQQVMVKAQEDDPSLEMYYKVLKNFFEKKLFELQQQRKSERHPS